MAEVVKESKIRSKDDIVEVLNVKTEEIPSQKPKSNVIENAKIRKMESQKCKKNIYYSGKKYEI